MSDSPKKPKRRRRPRRRPASKSTTSSQPAASSSSETTQARPKRSSSSSRRRRGRRQSRSEPVKTASAPVPSAAKESTSGLVVHTHDTDSMNVSSLDKGIFIYTCTLRPRRLLDTYQGGPSVVERMKYEDNHSAASPDTVNTRPR